MSKLLLGRTWVKGAATTTAAAEAVSNVFGVAQWNILADSLSDAFPKVEDKTILSWDHRFPLIVSEMRNLLDMGLVICAEELDHFDSFQEALKDVAESAFAPKDVERGDGSACFIPNKDLQLVEHRAVKLMDDGSQVVLLCRIRSRYHSGEGNNNHSDMIIASTHLKAKVGYEALREKQTEALIHHINNFQHPDDMGTFVGGDFNDVPDSLAAQVMRDHGYESAYESLDLQTYTTSKIRENLVTRCIDYIWYKVNNSNNNQERIKCIDCINIPPSESLGPTALPLKDYPSDHFMIAAKFELSGGQ